MSTLRALDAVVTALGGRVTRQAPLGVRTTYRVGGPAAALTTAEDEDDLRAVHRALAAAGEPVPVLVLGQGSNLLVADAGFEGLVVCLGPGFDWRRRRGQCVRAGGATKLPVLARFSAHEGLHGLEWAVGVPGSVGGALRMNAGGHGSDTAAVLRRCRLVDLGTGEGRDAEVGALDLGYRRSSLGPGDVVVWAEFALRSGDRARAEAAVAEVVRWRRRHQPGGSNAGSVFTNPEGDSAGHLVEAAGLKGYRLGTAQVSVKHANFIQADPGGAADDVARLVAHVRQVVAERTGVDLVPEVRMVGFGGDPTVPAHAGKPSTSTGGRGS